MRDLDDAKTKSGGERNPKMDELVDVYAFPDGKWTTIRLIPGIWSTAAYWIQTKKKDGQKTKFPAVCASWDPEAQDRDSTKYDPWRDFSAQEWQELLDKHDGDKQEARKRARVQFGMHYWMIGIIRSLQKNAPAKVRPTTKEKSSGFKDKESDTWTAKKAVRLAKGLADKIKELKGLNIFEGKSGAKAYSVTDVKYGRDIKVRYDSKKAAGEQYQVQLGDKRTPLTEEELAMLGWDMDTAVAAVMKVGKKAELKADFEGWASRNGVKVKKSKSDDDEGDESEDEDDGMDEDDDTPPKKGAKGKKPAPKKKPKADDEDDEEDDESEDEDDEEDEPPKKGKKAPAKKSKSDDDEDEEDEDDFDEDDEDSEDDDEDSEDDEDEDEPPKKGAKGKKAPAKKPVKGKKKPADDEEEEEDDFDEDDEEDEEDDEDEKPKGKSKKAPAKKPAAKGKKKPADDEDDDFDEDDEDDESEDEDEEDEPPKKGKKPAAKKAPAKKGKKSKDEDEDDDFDEDDEEDED